MSYNGRPPIKSFLTNPLVTNDPDIKDINETSTSTYYSPKKIEATTQSQVKLPLLDERFFQKVDGKNKVPKKQTLSSYKQSQVTVSNLETDEEEVFGPSGKSLYKKTSTLPPLTNSRSAPKLPSLFKNLGGNASRRIRKNASRRKRKL